MSKQKNYIAVDLGASNGRTILGKFNGSTLSLEELNRFENNYVHVADAYYWDVLHLYSRILDGLKLYAKKYSEPLGGIGIDTWGVDFGLIDSQGRLVGNPRAYRDPRNRRGLDAFLAKYEERAAFDITGIANLEYNTIYQLYSMVQSGDPQLESADKMLLLPDLLAYMLCGRVSCEYTHATTTQMLDAKGGWSSDIIEMMGIKKSLLPQIQHSGEKKADLYPHIVEETGLLGSVPVYCVGSHDTASAVASIPASTDNYAFLSSGTWSLVGIESEKLIINDIVYKNKFANEGTVTGGIRVLKNIMGLWILQNCKRQWDSKEKTNWNDIVAMAEQAPAFKSLIDVNAHDFFDGKNMAEKIQKYCEQTGQYIPQTKGEIARTVYESLAMGYKEAFDGLEELRGNRIDVLHVVGGGSQNKLLNQFTANAIGRPVIAGPAEATAIGNLMVQVKASGEVGSIEQMRQVIRDSFDVETYEPRDTEKWAGQYERYLKIKNNET